VIGFFFFQFPFFPCPFFKRKFPSGFVDLFHPFFPISFISFFSFHNEGLSHLLSPCSFDFYRCRASPTSSNFHHSFSFFFNSQPDPLWRVLFLTVDFLTPLRSFFPPSQTPLFSLIIGHYKARPFLSFFGAPYLIPTPYLPRSLLSFGLPTTIKFSPPLEKHLPPLCDLSFNKAFFRVR